MDRLEQELADGCMDIGDTASLQAGGDACIWLRFLLLYLAEIQKDMVLISAQDDKQSLLIAFMVIPDVLQTCDLILEDSVIIMSGIQSKPFSQAFGQQFAFICLIGFDGVGHRSPNPALRLGVAVMVDHQGALLAMTI